MATSTTTQQGGFNPMALEQAPQLPVQQMTPAPGTAATANQPNRPPDPRQSQAKELFMRQAERMISRGASDQDIYNYLVHFQQVAPGLINAANPPEEPPRVESPGFVRGVAQHVLQGLTFGFFDEAMGTLIGAVAPNLTVGEAIQGIRDETRAFKESHQGTALLAEIGGSLAGPGALAVKALGKIAGPGASLLRRLGTAVGEGAIAGAAQAAGDTEGGVQGRALNAVGGAAFGAAFGAGLVGTGAAAGSVVRPAVRKLTMGSKSLQQRIPGVDTAEEQARELLLRALDADKLTTNELRKRTLAQIANGQPTSLADIAGENVRTLLASANQMRSPVKQAALDAFEGRQFDQGNRILDMLYEEIFGAGQAGLRHAGKVAEEIHSIALTTAKPYYDEAYQAVVPITSRLRELLKIPSFRRAYERGRQIAMEEDVVGSSHGLKIPKLTLSRPSNVAEGGTNIPGFQLQLFTYGDAATDAAAKLSTEVPVRALDLMKRGLDELVNMGKRGQPGGLSVNRARSIRAGLHEVLEEAGDVVPAYKQARAIYQHGAEVEDAIEAGRGFLKMTRNQLSDALKALPTDNARSGFRVGALEAVGDAIGKGGAGAKDWAKFFGGNLSRFNETDRIRNLKALFPDPKVANEVVERIHHEAVISEVTRRAGHRSIAQPFYQQLEEVGEGMFRGAGGVSLGRGGVHLFARALAGGANRARLGWAREVSDELSLMFLKGMRDPADLLPFLRRLESRGSNRLRRQTAARLAAPVVGGAGAGAVIFGTQ